MTRLERRWTEALLEGFAPTGEGLVAEPGQIDWAGTFDIMRRSGTPVARVGLRVAVWLYALSPLWVLGRLRTIHGLPREERPALIGRLLEHRIHLVREVVLLFKIAAATALLGHPEVRARSGYDQLGAPVPRTLLEVRA